MHVQKKCNNFNNSLIKIVVLYRFLFGIFYDWIDDEIVLDTISPFIIDTSDILPDNVLYVGWCTDNK